MKTSSSCILIGLAILSIHATAATTAPTPCEDNNCGTCLTNDKCHWCDVHFNATDNGEASTDVALDMGLCAVKDDGCPANFTSFGSLDVLTLGGGNFRFNNFTDATKCTSANPSPVVLHKPNCTACYEKPGAVPPNVWCHLAAKGATLNGGVCLDPTGTKSTTCADLAPKLDAIHTEVLSSKCSDTVSPPDTDCNPLNTCGSCDKKKCLWCGSSMLDKGEDGKQTLFSSGAGTALGKCIPMPTSAIGGNPCWGFRFGSLTNAFRYMMEEHLYYLKIVPFSAFHGWTKAQQCDDAATPAPLPVNPASYDPETLTCEGCTTKNMNWCSVFTAGTNNVNNTRGGVCLGATAADAENMCNSLKTIPIAGEYRVPETKLSTDCCSKEVKCNTCANDKFCSWCSLRKATTKEDLKLGFCSERIECDLVVLQGVNIVPLMMHEEVVKYANITAFDECPVSAADEKDSAFLHHAGNTCSACTALNPIPVVGGGAPVTSAQWCRFESTHGHARSAFCMKSGSDVSTTCAEVATAFKSKVVNPPAGGGCPPTTVNACIKNKSCSDCEDKGCVWCGVTIHNNKTDTYEGGNLGQCREMPLEIFTVFEPFPPCGQVPFGTINQLLEDETHTFTVEPFNTLRGWDKSQCTDKVVDFAASGSDCKACVKEAGANFCSIANHQKDTVWKAGGICLKGDFAAVDPMCKFGSIDVTVQVPKSEEDCVFAINGAAAIASHGMMLTLLAALFAI